MNEVLKKDLKHVSVFFVIFVAMVVLMNVIDKEGEKRYLSQSDFYFTGEVKKVKEYMNHKWYIYEMIPDSISIKGKKSSWYFWGLHDTVFNRVYFLGRNINCNKVVIDSKLGIVYDVSTYEPIELIQVWSSIGRNFLRKNCENENTIRF